MIPLVYNARSMMQRPVSTTFTAVGIALVVAVFIGMLALIPSWRAALGATQRGCSPHPRTSRLGRTAGR